jgi:hypothetical protein
LTSRIPARVVSGESWGVHTSPSLAQVPVGRYQFKCGSQRHPNHPSSGRYVTLGIRTRDGTLSYEKESLN